MRPKRFVHSLAVIGGTLMFSMLAIQSASAHDYLVDSTPVEGQTLSTLPAEFSVTANSAMLDLAGDGTGFGIRVTDAAGQFYGDGCLTIAGPTLSTPAALGGAGKYLLTWQFVSDDGHPVSDTLSFTWAPDAGFVPSAGASTAPVCGAVAAPETPTAAAPTTAAEPTAAPTAAAAAEPTQDSRVPLLVGGGILAVVLAAGISLYLARRPARSRAKHPPVL